MTTQAFYAIMAAQLRKTKGREYAMNYCISHNVPVGLYRLACQLEATKGSPC